MGLYDDRLADLSEPRRSRRPAGRRSLRTRPVDQAYPKTPVPIIRRSTESSPTSVQSLLFSRDSGWTDHKAKQWAKSHGYKYGKVDVTEHYIRIRQFSPKDLKVKRTITLGRGIRAVVAREERMAKARRRTRRTKKAPARKPRRKARRAKKTAARRRRRVRAAAPVAVAAPRRRRRRRSVAAVAAVAAPKRRRRRRRASASAWRGNSAGHRKAAKKGIRRKKARRGAKRRRRVSAVAAVAAPRRRRRRRVSSVMAPRRRRSYARASRSNPGMGVAEFALAFVTAGLGYVIADGVDRFLATYNPTAAEMPKDKFTSTGAGTLANTLNVASAPGLARIGAGTGLFAVPAVGSMYIRHPLVRSSMQGMAFGSGVSLFKMLWNNFLMPMLKPKDTSAGSLQKSYIARLYPAEVAAAINREQKQIAVASSGSGALSGADVGPYALAAESPYPDAGQALRYEAGLRDSSPYPDAAQALRRAAGLSADSPYASSDQALRRAAGMADGNPGQPGLSNWAPGPPPGHGPGPQPGRIEETSASCGCGDINPYLGFVGEEPKDEPPPLYAQ